MHKIKTKDLQHNILKMHAIVFEHFCNTTLLLQQQQCPFNEPLSWTTQVSRYRKGKHLQI